MSAPERSARERLRLAAGEPFPAYTAVGGYPILYINRDGDAVCVTCANRPEDGDGDAQVTHCDVYWEGPALPCECCGDPIPSAYGSPEGEDQEGEDQEGPELPRL